MGPLAHSSPGRTPIARQAATQPTITPSSRSPRPILRRKPRTQSHAYAAWRSRGHAATVGRVAHKLKGSAGNLGAVPLTEACRQLETALSSGMDRRRSRQRPWQSTSASGPVAGRGGTRGRRAPQRYPGCVYRGGALAADCARAACESRAVAGSAAGRPRWNPWPHGTPRACSHQLVADLDALRHDDSVDLVDERLKRARQRAAGRVGVDATGEVEAELDDGGPQSQDVPLAGVAGTVSSTRSARRGDDADTAPAPRARERPPGPLIAAATISAAERRGPPFAPDLREDRRRIAPQVDRPLAQLGAVDVGRRCRVRLTTRDVDRRRDYATASTPLRGCLARKRSISATTSSGSSSQGRCPA
jgi:HPt (histidine-containing phosphotransfer) domain-containing protein